MLQVVIFCTFLIIICLTLTCWSPILGQIRKSIEGLNCGSGIGAFPLLQKCCTGNARGLQAAAVNLTIRSQNAFDATHPQYRDRI